MAAASTIDALLYVMRRGLSCFDDPTNLRRLSECDDKEFRDLVDHLKTWPGGREWLRSWTDDELRQLTAIWQRERKRRVGNGADSVR